jgi:hypothetical protein
MFNYGDGDPQRLTCYLLFDPLRDLDTSMCTTAQARARAQHQSRSRDFEHVHIWAKYSFWLP